MAKKKNTKWDLSWIIPEIVGSSGFVIAALVYLSSLVVQELGLWFFIFNVGLVLVVIQVGVKGLFKGLDELLIVIKNRG